jgi:hypothetical protein
MVGANCENTERTRDPFKEMYRAGCVAFDAQSKEMDRDDCVLFDARGARHRMPIPELGASSITETNRTHLILLGMQNRIFGPC